MKITVERNDVYKETEVVVKCQINVDGKTKKLLAELKLFSGEALGLKDGEAHKLLLSDVFYIDCVDEKIFLYLENEIYESKQKLYEWEQELADTPFVRISKATILNTDKLKSVRPLLSGKLEATLNNGEKQMINRHYVVSFRQKFGI